MAWITGKEQQVSTWDSVFWNFRSRSSSGLSRGENGFSKLLPFPRRPWVGLILAEAPSVGLHLPLCGMNRNVSSET